MSNKTKFVDCNDKTLKGYLDVAEENLGIKLPRLYIDLLSSGDGGTPIASDFQYFDEAFQETWWSGIGVFLSLSPESEYNFLNFNIKPPDFFPSKIVAFAENGGGDYLCFDYRVYGETDNPPIVLWRHGAPIGKDVSFVAKDFSEFLSILKEPDDI